MVENFGRIAELWRYPVKSMGGERLNQAELCANGIIGDRAWAARDLASDEICGAKQFPKLLQLSGRFACEPSGVTDRPPVIVTFPDGQTARSDESDFDAMLSGFIDHPLALTSIPVDPDLAYFRRTVKADQTLFKRRLGIPPEEELPDFSVYPLSEMIELGKYTAPPGTHFDAAALHLLTTNALGMIAQETGDSRPDVRRFRPNIVIESALAEEDWIGGVLHIGNAKIAIDYPTVRCAMPGQSQPGLASSPQVTRILRDRFAGFFGVYARVIEAGTIAEGDDIVFESGRKSLTSRLSAPLVRPVKRAIFKAATGKKHIPPNEARRLAAKGYQAVRLVERKIEANGVVSFHFSGHQGRGSLPGQYLTLRIPADPAAPSLIRRYTLSSTSSDPLLRITVKREQPSGGSASNWLHDQLKVGDELLARPALGTFYIRPQQPAPLLLLSVGIGITPMIAMLRSLAAIGAARQVHFLTAAAAVEVAPWRDELALLGSRLPSAKVRRFYPADQSKHRLLANETVGRIDASMLRSIVAEAPDCDAYVCGKPAFIEEMGQILLAAGVDLSRIHYEAFSGGVRLNKAAPTRTHQVQLSLSSQTLHSDYADETLLELLERHNIAAPSSCRYGACQACVITLKAGEVTHAADADRTGLPDNRILACCARPTSDIAIEI